MDKLPRLAGRAVCFIYLSRATVVSFLKIEFTYVAPHVILIFNKLHVNGIGIGGTALNDEYTRQYLLENQNTRQSSWTPV